MSRIDRASVYIAAIALICWLTWPSDDTPINQPTTSTLVEEADERTFIESQPIERAASTSPIEPVSSQPEQVQHNRTFQEIYADLATLFRTHSGKHGLKDGASVSAEASALFAEMVTAVPDAGQRSLGILSTLPTPWPADAIVDTTLCSLILDFNLQHLTNTDELAQQRAPLVHSLIAQMPMSEKHAQLTTRLLVEKPYLEKTHEDPLLELGRQATGELAHLRKPVQTLLITLWGNMNAAGETDYADLLHYFENGDNEAARSAAIDRLMTSDRFRNVIVARLIERQNQQEVARAANFAARALPFEAAIETVAALRTAAGWTHFGGAYAALAEGSPAELREHYEQSLGNSTRPRHREQVVLALGNYASKEGGLEVAQLALELDPSTRVKGVALLALSSSDSLEAYQQGFQSLIDNNALCNDMGDYLGASLLNAARRCDVNWIDEATRRVLALSNLPERRRAQINDLRRQYLPN